MSVCACLCVYMYRGGGCGSVNNIHTGDLKNATSKIGL